MAVGEEGKALLHLSIPQSVWQPLYLKTALCNPSFILELYLHLFAVFYSKLNLNVNLCQKKLEVIAFSLFFQMFTVTYTYCSRQKKMLFYIEQLQSCGMCHNVLKASGDLFFFPISSQIIS